MFRKMVLDNGIRIVTERMSCVKSVSIGLWVNTGSRDESKDEQGMSHFLEHMFFKGTKKRSAKEIALAIDAIGGEFNAFTSRETTTFYAKVLDTHIPQAIDLLSDNFHGSQFNSGEVEKEQQVVIQEIKMVEDDPEDLVHDLHAEDAWQGNSLGWSILGTVDTVSGLTRKKILQFLKRNYDPKEIVISVAGHLDYRSLIQQLDQAFGKYSAQEICRTPREAPQFTPGIQIKRRKLEQVHLCLGVEGLPQGHPDRYVLSIINALFGGSVSSRLFQEIREKRGLVYSIYSHISSYQDGGLFTVYAGTSAEQTPKVIALILKEFKRFKEKGIDPFDLTKAKEHIKGSLLLSVESTSSRMSKLASEELYYGRHYSLKEIVAEVDQVTLDQVKQMTDTLFDTKSLVLTLIGKVDAAQLPETLSI